MTPQFAALVASIVLAAIALLHVYWGVVGVSGRSVGFFKRVHGSRFAMLDTRYFSPLCLALGALALWAAFGPAPG